MPTKFYTNTSNDVVEYWLREENQEWIEEMNFYGIEPRRRWGHRRWGGTGRKLPHLLMDGRRKLSTCGGGIFLEGERVLEYSCTSPRPISTY